MWIRLFNGARNYNVAFFFNAHPDPSFTTLIVVQLGEKWNFLKLFGFAEPF